MQESQANRSGPRSSDAASTISSLDLFGPGKTSARTSVSLQTRVQVAHFSAAYAQLNRELNASMGTWRRNAARIVTGVGTFASVGGAVAMAPTAPAALIGLLSGVGIPHDAAQSKRRLWHQPAQASGQRVGCTF